LRGGFGEVGVVGGDEAGELEDVAAVDPVAEAAFAPVGEVLPADGHGVEFGGEDFLDGRQGVDPGEDDGGVLAVVDAVVELVADAAREGGDFCGHIIKFLVSGSGFLLINPFFDEGVIFGSTTGYHKLHPDGLDISGRV
jgi:hypothetical protein